MIPCRQLLPSSRRRTTVHPFVACETCAQALFTNSSTPITKPSRPCGKSDSSASTGFGEGTGIALWATYQDCGLFESGFARVRCPSCKFEFLVAFSCRCRGLCPSCGAKRSKTKPCSSHDHCGGSRANVRQHPLKTAMIGRLAMENCYLPFLGMMRAHRVRRSHDHRLRDAIAATGNADLFRDVAIPASTRRTWARGEIRPVVASVDVELEVYSCWSRSTV